MRRKSRSIPKPDAAQRVVLDGHAAEILAEAACADTDGVYSVIGGARENISIVHQQIRSTNLAWALGHAGKVKAGDVVAIVGGSFSGLTLAVELAASSEAIVYIFEKGDRLLSRFRDKAHRYLSPALNSRALGRRFDPAWSTAHAKVPVFEWTADWANEVASQWESEFNRLAADLPIFVFQKMDIAPKSVVREGDKLHIDMPSRGSPDPIVVDVVIDATGFGEETNPEGLVDYSYWESGHRLLYENLPDDATVVISGCGDSGVVEALHYAVQDFRHDEIKALWPQFRDLDLVIDQLLIGARLEHIVRSQEVERYATEILSEICWWLDIWSHFEALGRSTWWRQAGAKDRPIFMALDAALRPYLLRHFPDRPLTKLTWSEREDFVLALPLATQLKVRAAVDRFIDDRISLAMGKMAYGLPATVAMLRPHMRQSIKVILNGLTPTPYTRQLSPYNVWTMRLLRTLPCVTYRQGKIETIKRQADGRYEVSFDQGAPIVADRAVTRYGVDRHRETLAKVAPRDDRRGDWLLTEPYYTARDCDDPRRIVRIYPAREQVTLALAQLKARRRAAKAVVVAKPFYIKAQIFGADWQQAMDPNLVDPQARLVNLVRKRTQITFVNDDLARHHGF